MEDLDVATARYVDDIYIFLKSVAHADSVLKSIIPFLRNLDLNLNEAKSSLFPTTRLIVEEPDLDALFQAAVDEIREQLNDNDFLVSYGFQSEWDEDERDDGDEEEIELRATETLFDSIDTYRGHEEKIERFCLPLFLKTGSSYAVEHVLAAFKDRPSMCQIFCAYLGKFMEDDRVFEFLINQLEEKLHDWQRMWVIGALLQRRECPDPVVRSVMRIFRDGQHHDCVRAVAAIFVGRKGDQVRISALANECAAVSAYVQAAICFSPHEWKGPAKANMKAQWGNRGELNVLITKALGNAAAKVSAARS